MISYLLEAFFLGLSTGPVCLAYCVPVIVPFVTAEEKYKPSRTFNLLSLFLLGRLIGYIIIGLITGMLGRTVSEYSSSRSIAVVIALMGIVLLVSGFLKNFPESKLCRRWSGKNPDTFVVLILGLLTGLNICPPFLVAVTDSVTIGAIYGSILFFIFFFIATSLFILPLFVFGHLSRIESIRSIAKICLILCGIWFLYKGIMMWMVYPR